MAFRKVKPTGKRYSCHEGSTGTMDHEIIILERTDRSHPVLKWYTMEGGREKKNQQEIFERLRPKIILLSHNLAIIAEILSRNGCCDTTKKDRGS